MTATSPSPAHLPRMPIFVDDREQPSGLPGALEKALGHPPAMRRLVVGDVAIGERLVIERKTVADFVTSLLDGRLDRQLLALTQSPAQALLIIEGAFERDLLGGLSPKAIRQTFLSIELDYRIPVLRSINIGDTALWVATLVEREFGDGRSPLRFKAAPGAGAAPVSHRPLHRAVSGPEGVPMAALRRIPGLGHMKILALLERFGTMQALMAASEEDLAAVTGIGPTLARTIHKAFRG